MLNKNLRAFGLLALALVIATSFSAPAAPAFADDGEDWSNFLAEDGSVLPTVIQAGEVTMPADWMPSIPGLPPLEATYNVMVSPEGETVLMPSATTLFFMAMNPTESGLIDANNAGASGLGTGIIIGGQVAAGNGADFLSGLYQSLTGMSQVQADQLADAAINGDNAWAFGLDDIAGILWHLVDASVHDGNLYTVMLLYGSCTTSPTGCPDELCAANPVACGLPTPPPTSSETPEPTPTDPPTCPGPTISQAIPSLSISATAPNYPVVVGQDPDKRGVDIVASVRIPPVIYTWYEPRYEQAQECRASGSGPSNCTRGNGQPGWLRTVPVLVGCEFRQTSYEERITNVIARSEITDTSADWIVNDLGAHWYGAHVKQASFNLLRFGTLTGGCAGGTCSVNLTALEVPYADPGFHTLTIRVGTAGTPVTRPRVLNQTGEVGVWVILPTLIQANP